VNGALALFRELVPYSHCLRGARSRSAKADAAHVLAKDAAAGAGWARATAVPHARLGSSSDSSSSAPLAQDKVLAPLDCCSPRLRADLRAVQMRMRQLHAELEDLDRWSSRCATLPSAFP
jgi:hypothetical protein